MRTLLLTTLATVALAGAASAQINAPNPPTLHSSGSLLWPRDDSYAYLRGHGIDKDEANIITETLVPQGLAPSIRLFSTTPPTAVTAQQSPVSARVRDFSFSNPAWSTWNQHQSDCAAIYPTYDARVDMFMDATGQRQFCQVGLASGPSF